MSTGGLQASAGEAGGETGLEVFFVVFVHQEVMVIELNLEVVV